MNALTLTLTDTTTVETALSAYSALAAEFAITPERTTPRPDYRALQTRLCAARCTLFALAGSPETEDGFCDALEAYTACVEAIAKTPAGSVPRGIQQRLCTTRRQVETLLLHPVAPPDLRLV